MKRNEIENVPMFDVTPPPPSAPKPKGRPFGAQSIRRVVCAAGAHMAGLILSGDDHLVWRDHQVHARRDLLAVHRLREGSLRRAHAGGQGCPDAALRTSRRPGVGRVIDPEPEVACRSCGCTESRACPGGCWWVDLGPFGNNGGPMCSRCAQPDLSYDWFGPEPLDEDAGVLGVGQDGDHATLG